MRPVALAAIALLAVGNTASQKGADWRASFALPASDAVTVGRNRFFVLDPGYQLTLEDGAERLVITVLNETRTVDGIETRVVEERETDRGQLREVSRNFFAMHRRTLDVFYFGEEVDIYKDGRVVAHEGAWQSGAGGATFGLMMPGAPALHDRYYQERAPRVAMDRAEIAGLNETVRTPAGVFTSCLKTTETTPLEPGARESKFYAPGIGIVQDGSLKLVSRHDPSKLLH